MTLLTLLALAHRFRFYDKTTACKCVLILVVDKILVKNDDCVTENASANETSLYHHFLCRYVSMTNVSHARQKRGHFWRLGLI